LTSLPAQRSVGIMSMQLVPHMSVTGSRPLSFPARIASCFAEARPQVQMIFFLRLLAGLVLARPPRATISPGRLIAVAAVWELAIMSVYLFDGVMDIVEDRLNGSTRPIARGDLPRGFAAAISGCAAAAAVAGAMLLGWPYELLVPVILMLGYLYCAPPVRLKRWSGTAGGTVTMAGLLTVVAGAAVNSPPRAGAALVVFAVVISLWMGLVGAVAKDFPDIEGDAAAGCRNTALLRHERAIRLVAGNAFAVAGGFLIAAWLAAPGLIWPAIVMLAGAAAVAGAAPGAVPTASRARRRRPYNAFMVTQYLVHVAVLAGGLVLVR